MILGAHTIIYSRDAAADRAFFRDVLELPFVDSGDGWLIFALPSAEAAVHPAEKNDAHELFLLVDDIRAFLSKMKEHKVACDEIQKRDWGLVTRVALPGGGHLGVYQPLHKRPV